MYKNKKTGILGIVITIIILILLVILTNTENSNLSFVENLASKLVMPVQNGLTYVKNKASGNTTFFKDMSTLKEENQKLKEENSKLEQANRELEAIKSENETLKQYLNLTEKYSDYEVAAATVITRDITNYSNTIVIHRGKADGIEEKMTVIADKGLVGYVISVTQNTAKIQTIIDSASATSCLLGTSRDSIVCKGMLEDKKNLRATYISTDANVAEGDSVETSGLGGIYPKGIYIGTVKKVENTKNKTDRYALVEVAVDFQKLETVAVIINE